MLGKSVNQWLEYLKSSHVPGINLGLERIAEPAKELSLTSFECPVVTVGGTNGKGSTIRLLESLYCASGYRVGVYTSPHLINFNERIVFNQTPISSVSLIAIFEKVEQALMGRSFSFFEFVTLAALLYFKQQQPDLILLEVGLGGRLDAVNVVDPDVSVITSIALDHVEYLGGTREEIAREKAGIFRGGKPAVCLDSSPPEILQKLARHLGANYYQIQDDFCYEVSDNVLSYQGLYSHCRLPRPQLRPSLVCGALCVSELLALRLPIDKATIQHALPEARLPGRFEVLPGNPPVVLDVAHNPASLNSLISNVNEAFPGRPIHMVLGVLLTKTLKPILSVLADRVCSFYCVDLNRDISISSRPAWSVEDIACNLKSLGKTEVYSFYSVADALEAAYNNIGSSRQGVMVVTGSFYTVAAAKLSFYDREFMNAN